MTMRALYNDRRGAVMLSGLCMAFFMVGATWFIFGVAKALVFRQRVQESADAAAFSAAAIHAKGMNLIAAINLIMFALTAVWLLLRTIEHAGFLLQTTVTWNAGNCGGTFSPCHLKSCGISPLAAVATPATACTVAHGLKEFRDVTKKARKFVGDVMDTTFKPLSLVQDVTARLAPAAGVATSMALGSKFGHFTIAVSPSIVPGEDLIDALGGDQNNGAPLGLPVASKRFGYLCKRAGSVALNKVKGAVGSIPILGTVLDLPIVSQVVDGIIDGTTSYLEQEFCSDNDWAGSTSAIKIFKEHGPKIVHGDAKNGSDMMQVWAFTRGVYTDAKDEHNVGIASRNYGVGSTTISHWYVAQAEIFFDCHGAWGDGGCNGNDNASYNMRWRARLRRLRTPNVGGAIAAKIRSAILDGPVKDTLRDFLGLDGPNSKLSPESLSSGNLFEQEAWNGLFDQGFGFLRGEIEGATGGQLDANNGPFGGAYH
jgi:hypothetical protein